MQQTFDIICSKNSLHLDQEPARKSVQTKKRGLDKTFFLTC